MFSRVRLISGLMIFFGLFLSSPVAHAGTGGIVIAQIYGAGGLSGANYRQDTITLFNPTSASVTASGWAIQIRSSTSSAAFTVYPLPDFTLAPGQSYLITGSSPTLSSYGAVLPIAADYLLTSQFPGPAASDLNILSSTAQTIALTSSTAQIPSGSSGASCPALAASNLVDVVGYGPSNCFQGSGPAPAFTTVDILPGGGYTAARSTSITRINRCIDQKDNSADFVTTALTFQNSASPKTPCPATPLRASAVVDPGVVYPGSPVTFTATVAPASGPAGAIASVQINLAGIGGSATQGMYDDGSHGDAVAGDGTYTFAADLSSSTVTGMHIANVIVVDDKGNTAIAPATFTVTTNRQTAAIHTVQTGAPNHSANIGTVYTVSGIVTGVRTHGFYLQARDSDADSDPTTSEAIYVNTGSSAPPASVVVSHEIQVTGVLTVVPPPAVSPTSSAAPFYGTELAAPTAYSVLSLGNGMPTPVTITPEMAAAGSTYGKRYQYQSMLVSIPAVRAVSGTSGALAESTEMYTSDGHFYGVVEGTPRPFREPGLSLADPIPAGGPTTVANFDGNGEVLGFDSTALGGAVIDVATGTALTNVVAIDDYSSGAEQLLISASTRPTVGTLGTFSPVIERESNEFTVGTQSMQRFYASTAAPGAVTITSEAYQRRLAKSALSIRTALLSPDVVAVQQMGTLASLTDLANKINGDAVSANDAVQPNYVPYLVDGNDAAAVNVGFLVNTNRVTVNSVTQVDKTATFTTASGASATLFDDPPLVLDATIKATASTAAYPVIVLSVNFVSPEGSLATTTDGQTLRLKRRKQAETIAARMQTYQAAGKNAMVAGNFGAPEFSDGVVDVLGLVKGTPAVSSSVVLGASNDYAAPSPALFDLVPTAPAQNRYSVIRNGSAEAVDHVVVTGTLAGGYMVFAHDNVDFPTVDRNTASRVERNADHDGAVAYFALPALTATSSASITPSGAQDFGSVPVNTASRGQIFTFTNTGNSTLTNIAVSATGDFSQTNTCAATLAVQTSCSINVAFTPTAMGARTGTLKVTSSSTVNPTLTVDLTGTGTTAPVATLSLSPSSDDFGTLTVNTLSSAATFLLTNTGQTAITGISVSATGDYTQTNSCGTTLAPCSTCSINVVFKPSASGSRNGAVTVTSNSTSSPTLTSTLTGRGADALTTLASVAPTSKDFGSVTVPASSTGVPFTFTNTGTATMTGIVVSTTGDFSQTNSCGYFLNPAASCTVNIVFKPTAGGTRSGTLNVASGSVLTSISTVATLTGTGVVPTTTASLTPASQDFGSVIVGATSSPQSFTFTNTGNTSLTSVAVSLSGTGYSQTNNCPAILAAGASCSIQVTFKPATAASISGSLTVTSSSTTSPSLHSTLTGVGVAPTDTITLSPASQDFGATTVGDVSGDFQFTLSNTGNTAVNNVVITTSGPFGLSTNGQGGNCGTTLAAGSSCTIVLVFNPVVPGSATGALTVKSSSTASPTVTSTLTASGTASSVTGFSLNASITSTTITAGSPASFPFSIASGGGYSGTLNLSCSGAPTYSTCQVNPASVNLPANGSATATVSITTSVTTTSSIATPRSASLVMLSGISFGLLCLVGFRRKRLLHTGLLMLLVMIMVGANGCGGGGSAPSGGGGGGGGGTTTTHKVAPGTYTYTLTATDGTTSKTLPFTVIVQ